MKVEIIYFVIIFLLIVSLGLVLYFIFKKKNVVVQPETQYLNPLYWSGTSMDYDSYFNIYTFPAIKLNLNNCGPSGTSPCNSYMMGNPTYDINIISKLDPLSITQSCIDVDQLYATKAFHTCTGTENGFNNCIGLNGDKYTYGENEIFYTNSICDQNGNCDPVLNYCAGNIGLIALNFYTPTPTGSGLTCASCDISGDCSVQYCDPSNQDQLFRISRFVTPNQTEDEVKPGQASTGLFGNIYHRETGLYLNADFSSSNQYVFGIPYAWYCVCAGPGATEDIFNPGFSSTIDPSQFNGCYGYCPYISPGSSSPVENANYFTLTGCTGITLTSDSSYNWIFLPSFNLTGMAIPQSLIYVGGMGINNEIQTAFVSSGYAGVYTLLQNNNAFALTLQNGKMVGISLLTLLDFELITNNNYGTPGSVSNLNPLYKNVITNIPEIYTSVYSLYITQFLTFNMFNSISQVSECNVYSTSSNNYCYNF
jgi:hypothetical protein